MSKRTRWPVPRDPSDSFRSEDPGYAKNSNFDITRNWSFFRTDESVVSDNGIIIGRDKKDTPFTYSIRNSRVAGQNVPDWEYLLRHGKSATTTFVARRNRFANDGGFSWFFRLRAGQQVIDSNLEGSYFIPGLLLANESLDSSLDDEAKASFIRKARGAQMSACGMEFVKDLGETIHSFKRLGNEFLDSLYVFTRDTQVPLRNRILSKYHRQRKDLKELSDSWLEWNFGRLSAIRDLEDIADGCYRAMIKANNGLSYRVITAFSEKSQSASAKVSIPLQNGYAPSSANVIATGSRVTTDRIVYRGSVRVTTSEGPNANLGVSGELVRELGFNLSNFLPSLWECIPYSFVVDYFTNAGQIINAVSFLKSDINWAVRTQRSSSYCRVGYEPSFTTVLLPPYTVESSKFHQIPAEANAKFVSRVDFSNGSFVPSFRWHLPYRTSDWFNMLSLIGSKLSFAKKGLF